MIGLLSSWIVGLTESMPYEVTDKTDVLDNEDIWWMRKKKKSTLSSPEGM